MAAVFVLESYSAMAAPCDYPRFVTSWRERLAALGAALLLHLAVLAAYWLQPEAPQVAVNELSISFANLQLPQADIAPQPQVKPEPKPKVPEPQSTAAEEPAAREATPSEEPPSASPPAPVQLDAEPDYRADYLNNPRPPYPLVARRMGYQGRVVLNVEVLADGRAGQVLLHQSSGYEILDKAALQTVQTWRFSPARRLGQPVTQWFLVPIRFSLEDDER